MSAVDVLIRLSDIHVLPVVVIDDPGQAVPLARALVAGGVPCAEVTLRTPGAIEALRAMAGVPDFVVGCGTALSSEQVDASVDAGATFVVSPGLDESVADRCRALGVPHVPGVATATEVMRARAAGFTVQKFFPAAQLGGAAAIAALAGPFPDLRFVPSGGVGLAEAASYRGDAVHSVSTSWITPRDAVAAGRFDLVTDRARAFRDEVTA
jgi:2-dehydro-3-deoxyphosphogluconate aldolase/(4S)-4-hydroxy-2-oxoglutarate aldolase